MGRAPRDLSPHRPVLHIYALHEALRHTLVEARSARHEQAGRYLQAAIRERRLDLLADQERQLPHLTAVRVPDGVDGKRLLDEHRIEVGGGLGQDTPAMWRIGLMGHKATVEVADRVLAALDAVLAQAWEHARGR